MWWFLTIASFLAFANAECGNYLEHNVSLDQVTGDQLTIHLVTHTHDDPGWLITVDQYYVQEVEWIFYTMIPVLADNTMRKFTYGMYTSYFVIVWYKINHNENNIIVLF